MNSDRSESDFLQQLTLSTNSIVETSADDWLCSKQLFDQHSLITSLQACNEIARLNALYQYQVLDTPPVPTLDELTELAAEICQTPIALISFVDAERQWFKSRVGIAVSETPRSVAFCAYAIQQTDAFIVRDALADERFANNPLVIENPQIRFYAGMPLITAEGFSLGTLCVIDYEPRDLSQKQLNGLQTLSRQVMAYLELERHKEKLQATAIEVQQLKQQFVEQKSFSQQEFILLSLANQIRNSLELNTILQTAVNEIRNLLQVDRCHFLWCMPSGDQLRFTITHEAKAPDLPSLLGDLPDQYGAMLTATVSNLEIFKVDDVQAMPALGEETQAQLRQLGITSELLIPLKTHSGQLGAIVCSHCRGARQWTDHEVGLLQAVTDQLTIGLNQAELFAQTRATALAAQTQAKYLAEALQTLQQTQMKLIQHEKMSSLGQLVAGVAHEINNPVNFINGNIVYAADYVQDLLELVNLYHDHYPEPAPAIQAKAEVIDLQFLNKDLPKLLASMKMGVDRIRQIVLSLRNFSRLDEAEVKQVDIHEGIDNTLLILQNRLKVNNAGCSIKVVKKYENLPLVECYAGQLNQVFMNVLSNAIDALDEVSDSPTITIYTDVIRCLPSETSEADQKQDVASLSQVIIRIQDNGSGINETVKQKLFNPFFTTKPVGKGTGLGLSISHQIIVEKHNGVLTCFSAPQRGTEFWIQIPVKSASLS